MTNDFQKIKEFLERIATSLERIADSIGEKQLNDNGESKSLNNGIKEGNIAFVNDFSEIEDFLSSRNIKIKNVREENEGDRVLDKIAFYMGNRYSFIKKFYRELKRNLNTATTFKMDLRNLNQNEIASITQLCTQLNEIAFLEEYTYFRAPKYVLFAKPNRIPKAINFLTGGWLERYVKTAVIDAIKEISKPVPLNYSYLKNPQIVLPNGDDFELDIIFKIEDEIFWFEAKTGDYQKYIDKYSKMADRVKLDKDHAFMILTDITESGAKALQSVFGMRVVRIDDFYQTFKDCISHLRIEGEEQFINDELSVL